MRKTGLLLAIFCGILMICSFSKKTEALTCIDMCCCADYDSLCMQICESRYHVKCIIDGHGRFCCWEEIDGIDRETECQQELKKVVHPGTARIFLH